MTTFNAVYVPVDAPMSERWTCWGGVRHGCGIAHRSEEAAEKCCRRDNAAVRAGHGPNAYSDRRVVPLTAGQTPTSLGNWELSRG